MEDNPQGTIMPAINLTARLNRDQTFETFALTPSAKCLYLTSEDHANEFVMTAQDADTRQDRITLSGNRFRHIDMVLIDDFQHFAGRTALQEQLLQTLRALHQAGR